ncbi:NUDIX hydrolase [Agarilytica rhodophyticola]|uniref:NUDIX hydrolase n=1 Tax=Agarilytica rhodophyticola TaxID=1737490 RepID=UPI000B348136|nr:NUDIX hydrolase [Agarilytica rhodophyticola]
MNDNNPSHLLPHITVATIVVRERVAKESIPGENIARENAARENEFLFVIEAPTGNKVYNQPAGHMEVKETLFDAAKRETLEETAWHVELKSFLGVSHYHAPSNGITYIRHSFVADALYHDTTVTLDTDILDTVWLTYEEIVERRDQLRSPLVLQDIENFRLGKTYDLNIIKAFV